MKRSSNIVAILALVAGALARPAGAEDSKVRGKVHDEKGAPLAGASIRLVDEKSGHKYAMKAGKDGSFYQRGIFPATYVMTTEMEGYTPHITEGVTVQAGVERSFDIKLNSIEARSAEMRKEKFGEAYVSGLEAFNSKDYEKALAGAEETITKKPEDVKGYELKSKALISLKRYAEAIPVLEKLRGMPEAPADAAGLLAACHFNSGVISSNEGKVDEAIPHWEKALELGYPDVALENHLGQAYLQKADFDKALKHMNAYLAKSPTAADAAQVKQTVAELEKLKTKK